MEEEWTHASKWRAGDIIRRKASGKPYLITQILKRVSAVIVDLEDKNPLSPALTLLARDFNAFALDEDMEVKKNSWSFNLVVI